MPGLRAAPSLAFGLPVCKEVADGRDDVDNNDSVVERGPSVISLIGGGVVVAARFVGRASARELASSLKLSVSKYEAQALRVWKVLVSLARPTAETFPFERTHVYRPTRTKVYQPKLAHGRNSRLHRIKNGRLGKGNAQRCIRYLVRMQGVAVCRLSDIVRLGRHGIRVSSDIDSARGQVICSGGHAHGGALRNVPIVVGVDGCFIREGCPNTEDDGRGDGEHEAGPSEGEEEPALVFLAPA